MHIKVYLVFEPLKEASINILIEGHKYLWILDIYGRLWSLWSREYMLNNKYSLESGTEPQTSITLMWGKLWIIVAVQSWF